jgi:hypothetical protein
MRAYLSHPIRGKHGVDATSEDIACNNKVAMEFAAVVRKTFPNLDLYVPAEHDEFVSEAYSLGDITEDGILNADVQLIARRDLLIVFLPEGHLSRGMLREVMGAELYGVPTVHTTGPLYPIERALEEFKR